MQKAGKRKQEKESRQNHDERSCLLFTVRCLLFADC
jgi:hypothetical protein